MQNTLKSPSASASALCMLLLAWACTACDVPPPGLGPLAPAVSPPAQSTDSEQARRAAQLQLDELQQHMAAMRERLQHVAPQQREALERDLDALDALWRQTQRALVASGLADNAALLADPHPAPSTHPPQEPAPWKKSG